MKPKVSRKRGSSQKASVERGNISGEPTVLNYKVPYRHLRPSFTDTETRQCAVSDMRESQTWYDPPYGYGSIRYTQVVCYPLSSFADICSGWTDHRKERCFSRLWRFAVVVVEYPRTSPGVPAGRLYQGLYRLLANSKHDYKELDDTHWRKTEGLVGGSQTVWA